MQMSEAIIILDRLRRRYKESGKLMEAKAIAYAISEIRRGAK